MYSLAGARRAVLCCAELSWPCSLALFSSCELLPVSTSSKHRGNEAGKQVSPVPCVAQKSTVHGMETIRFAERSKDLPDLLGKSRRSRAQTCSRVDSLSSKFANNAKMSLPLSVESVHR
jgi:hypothetical protein